MDLLDLTQFMLKFLKFERIFLVKCKNLIKNIFIYIVKG